MSIQIRLRDGRRLGIAYWPEVRRRPFLYRMDGDKMVPMAYFKDEAEAEWFEGVLNTIVPFYNQDKP